MKGRPSLKGIQFVAAQSVLWFINNCIYFAILRYTTVATLSILMQLRLPITGILHHFLVRPQKSLHAWCALTVIYIGVVAAQWTNSIESNWLAFTACLVLSVLSSLASIISERVLKSLDMPFWDQQFRVCLLSLVSSAVFAAATVRGGEYVNYTVLSASAVAFTAASIVAAAGAGLLTGLVVKYLDSVVKLIAQSVAAVATTVLIYVLFGSFKAMWSTFILGSTLLVLGTVVYALETTTNSVYLPYRKLYRRVLEEPKKND
ncbi:nucleotide-sugar transporter [Chytriomyces sp. MP71]|nr:nucleotide-sugar transporter [Chytriomyces sp. MP71]